MFHKIKYAEVLPGFKLKVKFENDAIKIYDVSVLVDKYPCFIKLKDNPDLFNSIKVDAGGYGVSWDDDLDISCNELWENGIEQKKLP